MKTRWSFFTVERSTVSCSSSDRRSRNGRAIATKSLRTEAASRRIVGPSRTRPFGVAAMTSFSASSAATMRCTVERARFTRCAIWPRLSPLFSSSNARRIVAARAITCTWLLSLVTRRFMTRPTHTMTGGLMPPCIVGHVSPKPDTAKRDKMKHAGSLGEATHGQEDRARGAFPGSGHRALLAADDGRRRTGQNGAALRGADRLRRAAPEDDGTARHRAGDPCDRRAGRADGAQRRNSRACRPRIERFPGQGNSEAARPLFWFRASCNAGCKGCCRRARALRARSEVLRRHDQRTYERQISRRPLL